MLYTFNTTAMERKVSAGAERPLQECWDCPTSPRSVGERYPTVVAYTASI
jgi:hypothetical protein